MSVSQCSLTFISCVRIDLARLQSRQGLMAGSLSADIKVFECLTSFKMSHSVSMFIVVAHIFSMVKPLFEGIIRHIIVCIVLLHT